MTAAHVHSEITGRLKSSLGLCRGCHLPKQTRIKIQDVMSTVPIKTNVRMHRYDNITEPQRQIFYNNNKNNNEHHLIAL
jgi:hypothetical protein